MKATRSDRRFSADYRPIFLLLSLYFYPLMGCISSGAAEADPSLRGVSVATRMEIIENPGNRDSLVDIHFAIKTSPCQTGSRYRTRIEFTTAERGFIQGFEDDSFASDTLMSLSWTFTQEVAKLKGQTIKAAVSLNGKPIAWDSVTYY